MKDIKTFILEASNPEIEQVKSFIEDNYDVDKLNISNKPNRQGMYEVSAKNVELITDVESLTNGMFIWKEVDVFKCEESTLIQSLEGSPEIVNIEFSCRSCSNLKTLMGSPITINGEFNCSHCDSLETLEGSPEKIGKDFQCCGCKRLKSLKGGPKIVGGDFNCNDCERLVTLYHMPKVINGRLWCADCYGYFYKSDIIDMCKIADNNIIGAHEDDEED